MVKNTEMKLEILESIIPMLEKHFNTKIDLNGTYTFREHYPFNKEISFFINNTCFKSKCFTEDGEIKIDKFIEEVEEAFKILKENQEEDNFIKMINLIIEDHYKCKIEKIKRIKSISNKDKYILIDLKEDDNIHCLKIKYDQISNIDLEKLIIKIKKEIE